MTKLFCFSPELRVLEKQMQEPPGYRPRGYGISIMKEVDWRSRGCYSEIVDCVISRVRLGGVTLEQYILFHAAKDVYNRTKHIRLSELTDRELIPDEILRLIVNVFVIEKCGVEIAEQEVWNAD